MQTVATSTIPQEVPLSALVPSPTNPRQHFDEDKLNELAETIRKSGVYQAILARPKDNTLEIVFGERRYRASVIAGKETIPALIREMNDAEVLEAQLVENLQRRDVHPMEEAEGYKRLLELKEPTFTVEQIAAKVGKTPAYITTRLKLTDLCDDAAAAFYQEHIGVGHALLLAKLPADAAGIRAQGLLQRGAHCQRRQAHSYSLARPQSAILDCVPHPSCPQRRALQQAGCAACSDRWQLR